MVGDRETLTQLLFTKQLRLESIRDVENTGTSAITMNAPIKFSSSKNISTEGSGIQIGTATSQKFGFWDVTPVIQPAGANQVALDTYGAGANGFDEAAHASELHALVVEIRRVLVEVGIMKGAA